jgi:hypothetical protein
MAKILKNIFIAGVDEIVQDYTVESWHVSQSVDAFTGASDYDITISGSLTVVGPTVGSFTGSLQGTSSWANNAITASYVLQAVSSSYASSSISASYALNATTASYVLNAVSSSFASTASFINPLNQSVILTGSLNTSGSVILRGLDTTPKSFVVTIDNTTGQLFYTSSTGFLGTAGSPGPPTGSIQYNNAGTFGGVPTLTYDGTTLRATGSFTGSFVGNLTGTSSQATNAFTSSNLNITYNDNTNANFQLLWGSGTRAYGNGNIFVNPSTAKLFTQRFEVNGAWNATDGNGQIYLNGSTANRIEFPSGVGIGAPSTGTAGGTGRSTGTKIVLWPAVGSSPTTVDYAMGIENSALWYSVAGSTDTFKWYAGTTNIAKLTGTGALIVGNISPSATSGWIYASGDVVAFATSDKNLKDNITPISNPIEKIQKIGGYEFDWIPTEEAHSYEGHDIGVIAQEIEEVLPELVTTRDNGYKAVKYEKIVALLIEAIKDQQKQIDDLKSKIG